ncbi:MAG: hypothetical protein HFJ08_04515 [Lachnospiraceae bacterium]|nr:hypothetical protein [Lachnospiraceae bacterium]
MFQTGGFQEGLIFYAAFFTEKYSGRHLLPMGMVIKSYQRFIDAGQRRKTQLVRILTFPTPKGIYGYERKCYTHLAKYRFGKLILYDYDGYLRTKYGNYMDLPPVEKRKIHLVSKLKLLEE